MKRTMILILALAISLSLFHNSAGAQNEPVYLGEFCFIMSSGVAGIFDSTLELSVLSYGAGRFLLDGRIKGDLPPSAFVHGSGAMDGDKIIISLYSTEVTAPFNGSFTFYHIDLDATTLIGNYTNMGFAITPPSLPGSPDASAWPFIRTLTGGVHYKACL